MNTCDTCKHWAKQASESVVGPPGGPPEMTIISLYRECENPKVNGSHPLQTHTPEGARRAYAWQVAKGAVAPEPDIETEQNHTVPLDQATPDASDTHNLCFLTGPKFGCIHHEQGQ